MMLIDDGAFYQRVLVQKGELIEPSLGWGRRPGPVLVQELVGSYIQVGETLSVTLCIPGESIFSCSVHGSLFLEKMFH